MQILVSAVNSRERKMLGVPFAVGTVGSALLRHGQTTLPAQREHLNYCHVTSTEQDKPVSLPGGKRGRSTARGSTAVRVGDRRGSECRSVMGQIPVASVLSTRSEE